MTVFQKVILQPFSSTCKNFSSWCEKICCDKIVHTTLTLARWCYIFHMLWNMDANPNLQSNIYNHLIINNHNHHHKLMYTFKFDHLQLVGTRTNLSPKTSQMILFNLLVCKLLRKFAEKQFKCKHNLSRSVKVFSVFKTQFSFQNSILTFKTLSTAWSN